MDFLNPPTNHVGTALFLSYILAALVLTTRVALHLHTLHFYHLSHDTSPAAAARFATLATCATVIFATLSYHMLSFLTVSYASFCEARGLQPLPAPESLAEQLWAWMLDSALFADFARDLVGVGGTAAARAWARTALLWSLAVSVFLGVEGKRRGRPDAAWAGKAGEVVALAQVLPVSFALVLWLMGDVGEGGSPSSATASFKEKEKESGEGGKGSGEERCQVGAAAENGVEVGAAVPAAAVVYLAALPILSRAAEESVMKFVGAVFLLRACLAVPYLASRPAAVKTSAEGRATSSGRNLTYGVVAVGSLIQLGLVWNQAVGQSGDWVEIVEGMWHNPAVGAVSMDAVLGALSAVVLGLVE